MQKTQAKKPIAVNKILIVLAAVFVLAAVIFSVIFGVIASVRQKKAVAEYNGVTIDERCASYFVSYYKYVYVTELCNSGVDAYDVPEFWASSDAEGVSYGSRLIIGVRNFISDILVGNYYFDKYGKLDSNDRSKIDQLYESVISRFSEDRLGIVLDAVFTDKRAIKRAIEMYYKAASAKAEIYGIGGSTLMGYPDECEEYLREYSRVKLLFIRSENTFATDENGNRILADGGGYLMRDLTENELAERAELIAELDYIIDGKDPNVKITEEYFEQKIKDHGEGEDDKTGSGYYFSISSDYTAAFAADVSSDVVKNALEMKDGELRKVEGEFGTRDDYGDYTFRGVCYVYKCPVVSGVYTDTAEDGFFFDFYSDAADFLYAKMLEDMREDAVFTGKLTEDEIIEISYDSELFPRF